MIKWIKFLFYFKKIAMYLRTRICKKNFYSTFNEVYIFHKIITHIHSTRPEISFVLKQDNENQK